MTETTCRDEA